MSIPNTFQRDANRIPIQGEGLVATKSITYAASTTGAVGASALFTVTGNVVVRIFAKCTTDLDSGGVATIEVGITNNTASLIALTTATGIDDGEIWLDAGAATVEVLPAQNILVGGTDISQKITDATITGGVLTYYCLWFPLDENSSVVAT